MKKAIPLLLLLLCLAALLSGCSASTPSADADSVTNTEIPFDIEIREKMFVTQTNDIYLNYSDYLGKAVKYEGIFFANQDPYTNAVYHLVYRYGPGCCGDDDLVGFEVNWADGQFATPQDNDWVEVIGTLEEYEEDGYTYLRLSLNSLRILEQRGTETVVQ